MEKIKVDGMNCMHCSSTVKKIIENAEGTSDIDVSLEEKQAVFNISDKSQIPRIKQEIIDAGFKVDM